MTPHILAVALTSFLFATFAVVTVLLRRGACGGTSCGTGAGCGACPRADDPHADSTQPDRGQDHA